MATKTQLEYLGQKIVNSFRSGKFLEDQLCKDLIRWIVIHYTRPKVTIEDIPWIVNVLKNGSLHQRWLILDLTAKIATQPEIKNEILRIWNEEQPKELIPAIIFALLNIPDIDETTHKDIFIWIKNNKGIFVDIITKWFEGRENILPHMIERTQDISKLNVKKSWIRLICVIASPNIKEAKAYIESFPGKNWSFIEEVRKFALQELDEIERAEERKLSSIVNRFLAEKFVEDCRVNSFPEEEIFQTLHDERIAPLIRSLLVDSDLDWIMQLIKSPIESLSLFGLNLSRPFSLSKNLYNIYLTMWNQKGISYAIQAELLHRLTDFSDISIELNKQLFKFISNDWNSWINAVQKWTGGPSNVIDYCRRRIEDPNFISAKHWVYFCSAVASRSSAESLNFVKKYKDKTLKSLNLEQQKFLVEEVLPAIMKKIKEEWNSSDQPTLEIIAFKIKESKTEQFIATQKVRYNWTSNLSECKGRFLFKAPLFENVFFLCTIWSSLDFALKHSGERFSKGRFRNEILDETNSVGVFFTPYLEISSMTNVPQAIVEQYKERI